MAGSTPKGLAIHPERHFAASSCPNNDLCQDDIFIALLTAEIRMAKMHQIATLGGKRFLQICRRFLQGRGPVS